MSGSMRWWVLAFLAGLVLLGSALGFMWTQRKAKPPSWTPPLARVRCPDLDAPIPALLADADATPVLLWGVGKARLFVDGHPAFSAPENPMRFAPGEHVLRAEAEGAQPLELTFRLDAFRPAMFHVEQLEGLGLTLVYLGAACVSCAPALDKVSLSTRHAKAPDAQLLADAAAPLRSGDWRAAAILLSSARNRQEAGFRRLAAHVYQSTGQASLARAELEQQPELKRLVKAVDAIADAEAVREQSMGMLRWNLLTEKFSRLLEKFALEAPGPVQLATGRLAELSEGFLAATQQKDPFGQDDTVAAGEEALGQFIRALRRTRPEDCEFQARISAASR